MIIMGCQFYFIAQSGAPERTCNKFTGGKAVIIKVVRAFVPGGIGAGIQAHEKSVLSRHQLLCHRQEQRETPEPAIIQAQSCSQEPGSFVSPINGLNLTIIPLLSEDHPSIFNRPQFPVRLGEAACKEQTPQADSA